MPQAAEQMTKTTKCQVGKPLKNLSPQNWHRFKIGGKILSLYFYFEYFALKT